MVCQAARFMFGYIPVKCSFATFGSSCASDVLHRLNMSCPAISSVHPHICHHYPFAGGATFSGPMSTMIEF